MAAVSTAIPDSHKDLLERPVVVALVTLMPDGLPQATPVWCEYDGTHIFVNTASGRQKDKNMSARPHVSILAIDPDEPLRWMEVRGEVVGRTEVGGIESMNRLAKKYAGVDEYYGGYVSAERRQRETRVVFTIKPTRVLVDGP